ncbi:hypothetical protein C8R44DRAFT_878748 [Mycena epipterygia]|nr:hypothetical protein C8R44DRAFT_878748 [Mycena epipterygia]
MSSAMKCDSVKTHQVYAGVDDDIPIYEQPPSAAVDEAWEPLHRHPETRMSRVEAAKIPSSKFCIAWISYGNSGLGHIRHYIGTIRQALMCAADITPIVW